MKKSLIVILFLIFQACNSKESTSESKEIRQSNMDTKNNKEVLSQLENFLKGVELFCTESPSIQNSNAKIVGCALIEIQEDHFSFSEKWGDNYIKRVNPDFFEKIEWYVDHSRYDDISCQDSYGDEILWPCLLHTPKESSSITIRHTDNNEEITAIIRNEIPDIVLHTAPRIVGNATSTGDLDKDYIDTVINEQIDAKLLFFIRNLQKSCAYQLNEKKFITSENCKLFIKKRDLILKGECYDNFLFSERIDELNSGKKCEEKIFRDVDIYHRGGSALFMKDDSCLTLLKTFQKTLILSFVKCSDLSKLRLDHAEITLPDEYRNSSDDNTNLDESMIAPIR